MTGEKIARGEESPCIWVVSPSLGEPTPGSRRPCAREPGHPKRFELGGNVVRGNWACGKHARRLVKDERLREAGGPSGPTAKKKGRPGVGQPLKTIELKIVT